MERPLMLAISDAVSRLPISVATSSGVFRDRQNPVCNLRFHDSLYPPSCESTLRLPLPNFSSNSAFLSSFQNIILSASFTHTALSNNLNPRRQTQLFASYRWSDDDLPSDDAPGVSFAEGVSLFNSGQYYECHDVLEELWHSSSEPRRSILHGILQCSVALYHLLNQNHRGAMMELGEGLTKLRRLKLTRGGLYEFQEAAGAVQEFIYNTQLEHAACSDEICVAMDGSEESYRLLGNYGAGEALYSVVLDPKGVLHLQFNSRLRKNFDSKISNDIPLIQAAVKVVLPVLCVSDEDLRF